MYESQFAWFKPEVSLDLLHKNVNRSSRISEVAQPLKQVKENKTEPMGT